MPSELIDIGSYHCRDKLGLNLDELIRERAKQAPIGIWAKIPNETFHDLMVYGWTRTASFGTDFAFLLAVP
ncbi:hypothetical protein [Acidisoma sp. L85]|uniref:hypothetical protein n=1 Tax=Acidisoma sp. L85 TaxID=1641850 RepID=UPI00131D3A8C|nr:hypothetical protein [Acidisoma sp. L85]